MITSSPFGTLMIKAGLDLNCVKSEKGKFITIISPFTSPSMPRLPFWLTMFRQEILQKAGPNRL